MTSDIGQINFWVSGNKFPDFTHLYCDLVFVVAEKLFWKKANHIKRYDPLIESDEAFNDHYQWAMYQHLFARRRRFTLKARADFSFQPQTSDYQLIDIIPFLMEQGFTLEELHHGMRAGTGSRPFRLEQATAQILYDWINHTAEIKLHGDTLQKIRLEHRELASSSPEGQLNFVETQDNIS